jgi:N-acetylmuramoyl-L-alanine amidase
MIVGLFTPKDNYDIYTIGNYNGKKTLEIINEEDRSNPILIKDYNFYGESLNLYFESYGDDITKSNTLNGKTVVLKDLINTNNVITLGDLTRDVDNQIDLSKLTPGFYSLYIVDGDVTYRAYYQSVLSYNNTFYTVSRYNKNYKIEIIADKQLFDEVNTDKRKPLVDVLDQNYIYIKVTVAEEYPQYDIAISTSPALTMTGISLVGEEIGDFVEAEQMYELALKVKAELEAKGLKVLILKDEYDQDIQYYGKGGTLEKAYKSGAKYMIHLDMDYYGNTGIMFANRSSGRLAKAIFNHIFEDTNIFHNENYLFKCDVDDNGVTDLQYEIREAGGVALSAGTFSESAQTNTFAFNNKYGIDTIQIVTTNMSDGEEISLWNQQKDKVASAIVKGILEYLKIAN